jgi:hypothetical protein
MILGGIGEVRPFFSSITSISSISPPSFTANQPRVPHRQHLPLRRLLFLRCLLALLGRNAASPIRRLLRLRHRPYRPGLRPLLQRLPLLLRLLLPYHGPDVFRLPHLLPTHQHRVLLYLLHAGDLVRVSGWRVLAAQ